MLKKIGLGIAAVLAVLLVVGFLLPAQTHIERSVQIDASPAAVYSVVNDLHQFNQWSPWAEKSEDTQYRFEGPGQGVGSKLHWNSEHPEVGNGTQEIIESVPNSKVVFSLEFDGSSNSKATYLLEPNAEGTRMTWAYEMDNGMNLFMRFMGAFLMDGLVGPEFEKGLANLKTLVETAPQAANKNIITQEIPYEIEGMVFTGYLAYDANIETAPGVLVVHEWWGHNDYARKRAEMLAELGYAAFALDMYGDGKLAEHPDDAGKFSGEVAKNIEAATKRFKTALQVLKEHGNTNPEQIAAVGYCFGGGVVLNMAKADLGLDAVVSFHGSLQSLIPASSKIDTRVLALNGADDPFVTAEQKAAFKQEMEQANIQYEFVDYPGVQHSFTNPGATAIGEKFSLPLVYDEAADKDSWQRMQQLLEQVFKQ